MMTKSAQTLFFFALYLFGLGAILLVAPNWFLGLVGFPATTEVWIRVVGMLAVLYGVLYVVAARANFLPILEISVKTRLAVMLFFATFVALRYASPMLLLFGVIDVAGALWTWLALRGELGAPSPKGGPPSGA